MNDAQFFACYPRRQTHIRLPDRVLVKNKQRGVFYAPECEMEFRSLGEHDKSRRRIILWRVPRTNPYYDPYKPAILKIPFLAFADEAIEDLDEVLLPIVDEIMKNQLRT